MRKIVALAALVVLTPAMSHSADRSTAGRGHPQGPADAAPGGPPGRPGEAVPGPRGAPGSLPGPKRGARGGPAEPEGWRLFPFFLPGLGPWASRPGAGHPPINLPKPGAGARLSTEELRRSLKARGYRNLSDIRVMGENYVVHAIGPRGEHVTLVVNAGTSEILGSRIR